MGAVTRLLNLAAIYLEQGALAPSSACYREAIAKALQLGNTDVCAGGLDGLAAIAVEQGLLERAAMLAAAAEVQYETLRVPLDALEAALRARYVEKLEASLAPEALEREWARGRVLGLDAAVAEALESE